MVMTKKAEKALARLKKEREASANKKERSPASKAGKILAHTKWDSASSAQKQKYLRQLARARTAAKETMERKKKIKEIERKKAAREQKANVGGPASIYVRTKTYPRETTSITR